MIPHIYARTFGSGPRAALAIHCSLAHSGAWRGLGTKLGDQMTLHALDLPNHGKSGDWNGQGVMHDTATAMALAVLDGISDAPIDIIGHSFGATVALRLAIEHPTRVRSVAMFEPVYFAPVMADDPDFGPRYAADTADFDAAIDAGDLATAARAFNSTWADGTPWQEIPDQTRNYMTSRIMFVRYSAPFLINDSANLLAPGKFEAATMPALLMAGALSPWARPVNDAIARRLPNASQITMEGVGHMGPITHPGAVAQAWMDMLRQMA